MATMPIDGSRGNIYLVDPRKLTRVTDPAHFLFRDSVIKPAKPGLIASLEEFGYDKRRPIAFYRDGKEENDPRLIVDGRKIHAAAMVILERQLAKGTPDEDLIKVWVVQVNGDEADLSMISTRANAGAEEDSPSEKARNAKHQLELSNNNYQRVARANVVDVATIKRWENFLELPKSIRNDVDSGKCGMNRALRFHGMPQAEALQQYEASKNEAGQIDPKEVDARVSAYKGAKKEGKTPEQAKEEADKKKGQRKPGQKVVRKVRDDVQLALVERLPVVNKENAFALLILQQWIDYSREGKESEELAALLGEVSREAEKKAKDDKDAAEKSKEKGK